MRRPAARSSARRSCSTSRRAAHARRRMLRRGLRRRLGPGNVASTCIVRHAVRSKPDIERLELVERPQKERCAAEQQEPTASPERRAAPASAERARWRVVPATPGLAASARVAWIAGARLKSSAVRAATPAVKAMHAQSNTGSSRTPPPVPGEETDEERHAPPREEQSGQRAERDQHCAFGQSCRISLPRLAPIASRTAISFCRARGAGDQQVGDVGAADEQHHARRSP